MFILGSFSKVEGRLARLFCLNKSIGFRSVFVRTHQHDRVAAVRLIFVAVAAVLLSAATLEAAWSATPPSAPAAISAVPSGLDPSSATPAPSAHVLGFRSAKFGMSEDEVRSAINANFSQSGAALKVSSNPIEQTKIITIKVLDLLPESGAADVSYVFGYKTKKLIQVSVAWSTAIDAKNTPEKLVVNGEMLKSSFVDQGYKPDTLVVNKAVKTGILMFRGQDADDHTTVLLLQGSTTSDKSGSEKDAKVLVPNELLLLYIADVKRPDIFKVSPGQF